MGDQNWNTVPARLPTRRSRIVPTPSENPTEDELRSFLMKLVEEGKITKWAIPDEFRIVESIPKTSIGKIDKKVLRKIYS